MDYRIEHDSMGEVKVPADKYWGAQTERSHENFPIGVGLETMPREITRAFGVLKLAAARANHALKPEKMTDEKLAAIEQAATEVMEGKLFAHFPLVVWQTGSGTQSNMNANEVIANRALELLGHKKGEYEYCHPNNHVNCSQSTNDIYPTALRIALYTMLGQLTGDMAYLQQGFAAKSEEFSDVIKMGRTQLQDAVPMTLGQEFGAYATTIGEDILRVEESRKLLLEVNLGATAIGTSINAPKGYAEVASKALAEVSGIPVVLSTNLIEATWDTGAYVQTSGVLKRIAVKLSKICNDLRLLSSGPRTGINEINLPRLQPGSSIMPGKVNPTQCEAVTMVAVQVMGNDVAVSMAASQGNFELNVFMPVCIYNFLQSARLLSEAIVSFNDRCACGITANREKMAHNLHNSLMLVTALNPYIGYENAAKTAKKAYKENISLKEACVALGFLTAEKFDEVFHPENMV